MKKLSKITAFILCAMLMLSLCGCGISDGEKFVGTWEATIDMTEQTVSSLEAEMGEYMAYFDFSDLYAVMTYEFKEDGTYSMTVRFTDESVENFNTVYEAGLIALMNDSFAEEAEASGLSMEEYEAAFLEENTITIAEYVEAYIASIMADFDVQESMASSDCEGMWKALAGKLLFTNGTDEEFSELNYDSYEELTEDSFKLVGQFTDGEEDDTGLYPMLFKRIA